MPHLLFYIFLFSKPLYKISVSLLSLSSFAGDLLDHKIQAAEFSKQSRGFWHNFTYFQGASRTGKKSKKVKAPSTLVVDKTTLLSDQLVSASGLHPAHTTSVPGALTFFS